MEKVISRREAVKGAALMLLCGMSATSTAMAATTVSGGGGGRYSAPVSTDDKSIPKTNIVTIDSYDEVPTSLMNVVLRNYLQLLDLPFSKTGFDASSPDDASSTDKPLFELANGKLAGQKTDKVAVRYDAVETGEEKASKLYFCVYGALNDHCEGKTQEVIDAIAASLGLDSLEYTTEQSEDINCSILIKGAELVLDITNNLGLVSVVVRRSEAHSKAVGDVSTAGLGKLADWVWSIDAGLYTGESYNNMIALVSEGGAAWSVLNGAEVTAAAVFDATSQLQNAVDSLVTLMFPFTASDFMVNLNGALEKVKDKTGALYVALPGQTKDGGACIFVYDSNLSQPTVAIAFLDGDEATVPSADVGGIWRVLVFQTGSLDDFAPIVIASIMAEDQTIGLKTATDVYGDTLNAVKNGEEYWYNGRRFGLQASDTAVFIISAS